MLKKIKINKCYNIIKNIEGCLLCHKIKIKNFYKNINIVKNKIKFTYKKLYNFKNLKKLNNIMNNITLNLKNKFLLEISKYLNKINKFNFILLKI